MKIEKTNIRLEKKEYERTMIMEKKIMGRKIIYLLIVLAYEALNE